MQVRIHPGGAVPWEWLHAWVRRADAAAEVAGFFARVVQGGSVRPATVRQGRQPLAPGGPDVAAGGRARETAPRTDGCGGSAPSEQRCQPGRSSPM